MCENRKTSTSTVGFTLLEVVGFPDVNAHQGHQLQLRQPLPSGRRQRQQVSQVGDLGVDQVPPEFAGTFSRLCGVEPVDRNKSVSDPHNKQK